MHVLVATVTGNVVGTVAGVCNVEEGHLRGMAILPEWHGLGVAAKLLAAIETLMRGQGCKRITLDTTLPLVPAMKFYERNGYHRSGEIADLFGMPLLEYVKQL
jgi:GNAT superfamily N-acetyltransferase